MPTYEDLMRIAGDGDITKLPPLHRAIANGDISAVVELLRDGADLSERSPDDQTALYRAARTYHNVATSLELVSLLLDNGADIHETVQGKAGIGYTPLHGAILYGPPEVVALLIERGARVGDVAGLIGKSTLWLATKDDLVETALILLDHGADPNYINHTGATALHYAAERESVAVARLLLERGANVNVLTKLGVSALDIALRRFSNGVAELLIERSAPLTMAQQGIPLLQLAAHMGNVGIVRFLLERGADMSFQLPNGMTVLEAAAGQGSTAVVKFLLEHGADLNHTFNDGWTALMSAASNGFTETAALLLDNGANVNHGDVDGTNALHVATRYGHPDMVTLLLARGAEVDREWGTVPFTALLHAVILHEDGMAEQPTKVRLDILKSLLKAGASIKRDAAGRLPFEHPRVDPAAAQLVHTHMCYVCRRRIGPGGARRYTMNCTLGCGASWGVCGTECQKPAWKMHKKTHA